MGRITVSNSSFQESTLFKKGLVIQRSKHEVTKVVSLCKHGSKTAFAKLSVSNAVNSNIKSSLPIMVIFIMGNTDHSKLQTKV